MLGISGQAHDKVAKRDCQPHDMVRLTGLVPLMSRNGEGNHVWQGALLPGRLVPGRPKRRRVRVGC
jgi:hypothetical protein